MNKYLFLSQETHLRPILLPSLFLLLLLLQSAGVRAQMSMDTAAVSALLEKGNQLRTSRKVKEALPVYESALVLCDSSTTGWDRRSQIWYFKAVCYDQWPKLDTAILCLREARRIRQQVLADTGSVQLANIYTRFGLAFHLQTTMMDSALYYLRLSERMLTRLKMENSVAMGNVYRNFGNVNRDIANYTEAIAAYQKSYAINEAQPKPSQDVLYALTYSIGTTYRAMGNAEEARKYQEKALPMAREFKDKQRISNCIKELAWCDYLEYKFQDAERGFREVLKIRTELYGADDVRLADPYSDLGNVLTKQYKFAEAKPLLEKAIQLAEKRYPPKHPGLSQLYSNQAVALMDMGLFEEGLVFSEKALQGENLSEDKRRHFLAVKASMLSNLRRYPETITLLNQVLAITEATAGGDPNNTLQIVALLLKNHRQLQQTQKVLDIGLPYLQRSDREKASLNPVHLSLLHSEIAGAQSDLGLREAADKNFAKALEIMGIPAPLTDQQDVELSYALRTYILYRLIDLETRANEGDKDRAAEWLRLSQWAHQQLMRHYFEITNPEGRISLLNFNADIFTAGTKALMYFGKSEQAFYRAEQGKACNIASQWTSRFLAPPDGLPKEWIEQETALQNDIFRLREILGQKTTGKSDLQEQLYAQQMALHGLQQKMKAAFPDYFARRYGQPDLSLAALRSKVLDKETVLLEYLLRPSEVTVLAVTQDTIMAWSIQPDMQVFDLVQRFHHAMLHPNRTSPAPLDTLRTSARRLYELLLEKPLQALGPDIRRLLIVSDSYFSNLSFAALLSEPVAHNRYEVWPFVGKKYAIQYAPSAAMLLQLEQKADAPKNYAGIFAGFAPAYNESKEILEGRLNTRLTREGEYDLPYIKDEVNKLVELTGGKAWVGEAATETAFRNEAPGYCVLHCAMHAVTNEIQSDFSKLLFTAGPKDAPPEADGDLHLAELAFIPLSAEMVVLSACKTAVGLAGNAEVANSLANGFHALGIPSVIASQWPADDQQTLPFMLSFYKHLKAGLPKDLAIQKAQADCLQRSRELRELAHPYYWAPFILTGSRRALKF